MAKPKMLFSSADRSAAHDYLDALDKGKYPHAECREDANREDPYMVWSAPETWVPTPPEEPVDPVAVLAAEDALLDRLAERLAAKLAGGDG